MEKDLRLLEAGVDRLCVSLAALYKALAAMLQSVEPELRIQRSQASIARDKSLECRLYLPRIDNPKPKEHQVAQICLRSSHPAILKIYQIVLSSLQENVFGIVINMAKDLILGSGSIVKAGKGLAKQAIIDTPARIYIGKTIDVLDDDPAFLPGIKQFGATR